MEAATRVPRLGVRCLTAWLCVAGLYGAEPGLPLVRVCEVLHNLPSYRDKVVAVVGRFSYREEGRFLSEKGCDAAKNEEHPDAAVIVVVYDAKLAPKPARDLFFDRSLVDKELELIRRQTELSTFRFGSQDYDRWAVVYGRIEVNEDAGTRTKAVRHEFEPAPVKVVCSSKSMVVFLSD